MDSLSKLNDYMQKAVTDSFNEFIQRGVNRWNDEIRDSMRRCDNYQTTGCYFILKGIQKAAKIEGYKTKFRGKMPSSDCHLTIWAKPEEKQTISMNINLSQ